MRRRCYLFTRQLRNISICALEAVMHTIHAYGLGSIRMTGYRIYKRAVLQGEQRPSLANDGCGIVQVAYQMIA